MSEGNVFFFFGGVIFFLFSPVQHGTFLHSGKCDERKKEMEVEKREGKRHQKRGIKALQKPKVLG